MFVHIHVDPNSMAAKVIGVIGIPLFAAFLYFQTVEFKRASDSCSWPAVEGTVLTSEIEKGEGSSAKIKYRYTVQGQTHENSKVVFGLFRGMLTWGYADKLITHYPVGKTVKVFYNTQSPELSCLETGGIGWEDLFMFVVGVFGIVWGMKNLYLCYRWISQRILNPARKPEHALRQNV